MRSPLRFRTAAALMLALVSTAALAAAPPQPFTATYRVLSGDQPQGTATLKLVSLGHGDFLYTSQSRGTEGMAAMLGASSDESTRFHWTGSAPQTISYQARIQAFNTKQRRMTVDPSSLAVSVDEGKGTQHYVGVPGMVDRNTLPLALGLALAGGQHAVILPVGVRQRIEQQHYEVNGSGSVQVPAGRFQAEQVRRSDTDKPFDAWYAPQFPVPVKITQSEGGDLTLELVSFRRP